VGMATTVRKSHVFRLWKSGNPSGTHKNSRAASSKFQAIKNNTCLSRSVGQLLRNRNVSSRRTGSLTHHLITVLYGLFVPRTIHTLDYSYYGWTIGTLDDSYDGLNRTLDYSYDGLFVPSTVRTICKIVSQH